MGNNQTNHGPTDELIDKEDVILRAADALGTLTGWAAVINSDDRVREKFDRINAGLTLGLAEVRANATQPPQDERSCTCHPDDNPPVPCAKKYAIAECCAQQPVAISTLTDEQIRSLWQTTDTGDIEDDIMAFAHSLLAMQKALRDVAEMLVSDWDHAGDSAIGESVYLKAKAALAASAPAQQATPPHPVAAEVAKDAQRLDWLARNLFEYKWNGVIASGSRTDWFVRGDYRHTMQKMDGTTLREAIDAAMAGTGSDESKGSGNG